MELRRYFRILMIWKWVVLLAFVVTLGGTAAFVLPQPWVYQSTGTWLIESTFPSNSNNSLDAQDVVSRNVNIGASYATIARGTLIRSRADAQLGPGVDTTGTDVSADLITDTNILTISARGPDPRVARDLATAIGQQTAYYVVQLGGPFYLTAVDEAKVDPIPVAPNRPLTLALGGVLGLLLGIGLAMFAEYLDVGADEEAWGGLHSARALVRRVRLEMVQAEETGLPLSLGVLRLARTTSETDGTLSPGELRRVEQLLGASIDGESLIADMGGGNFAGIFPGTTRDEARESMARWKGGLKLLLEGPATNGAPLKLWVGVCEYAGGRFFGDATTMNVVHRLMKGAVAVGKDGRGERAGSQSARSGGKPPSRGDGKKAPAPAQPTAASDPPVVVGDADDTATVPSGERRS